MKTILLSLLFMFSVPAYSIVWVEKIHECSKEKQAQSLALLKMQSSLDKKRKTRTKYDQISNKVNQAIDEEIQAIDTYWQARTYAQHDLNDASVKQAYSKLAQAVSKTRTLLRQEKQPMANWKQAIDTYWQARTSWEQAKEQFSDCVEKKVLRKK